MSFILTCQEFDYPFALKFSIKTLEKCKQTSPYPTQPPVTAHLLTIRLRAPVFHEQIVNEVQPS